MSRMPDDFYVGMTLIIDLRPGGKPEVIIAVCVGQNEDVLTLVSVDAGDCYRPFDFVIAEDGEILDAHYSLGSLERLINRVGMTDCPLSSPAINVRAYDSMVQDMAARIESISQPCSQP